MCGRFFTHIQAMHDWAELLETWPGDEYTPSYNVAPTNIVPIITAQGLSYSRWGLIPSWSKAFPNKFATFNARIETAAEKPSFRSPWRQRQSCIVVCGGYYEWQNTESGKQAYVVRNQRNPIVMAGLWETWQNHSSFTILTEAAQGHMQSLHPRIPLILNPEQAKAWLAGDFEHDFNEWRELTFYKVSKEVGNVRNDYASLIEPQTTEGKGLNSDPLKTPHLNND